jgi:hypothetical protein
MGWFILILVLIAVAFGILGAVLEAVAYIVLTIVFTVLALGAIAYFVIRYKARRFLRDVQETNGRRQLPS